MPTNLPAQPWPCAAHATQLRRESDTEAELFVVLCFALSPLAVFLALLFLATPDQVAAAYICSEEQCMAP